MDPLPSFSFFTLSKYLINVSIFQFIVEFSLSGYFLSSLGSTDCVIFAAEYSDIFSSFEVENPNWTSRRPTARWSLLYSYVDLVGYIVSVPNVAGNLSILSPSSTFKSGRYYIFCRKKFRNERQKIYLCDNKLILYNIYGIYKKSTYTI